MARYNTSSDNELILLLKNGNHKAYLEIYDRYKTVLQHHAYKKLGNAEDVQDVLQELFINLWEKRESLQLTTSLSGYLFTAVRNRAFNVIYRKRRETTYLNSLQEFISTPHNLTDLAFREVEFSALIQKEINALPPRMREVFLLSREDGLSHKQIAQKLGTSETTVAKQMTNVLRILRIKLGSLCFLLFLTY